MRSVATGGATIAQVTAPDFSAATRFGRVWKARMSSAVGQSPGHPPVVRAAPGSARGADLGQPEGLVEQLVQAVEAPVVGRLADEDQIAAEALLLLGLPGHDYELSSAARLAQRRRSAR